MHTPIALDISLVQTYLIYSSGPRRDPRAPHQLGDLRGARLHQPRDRRRGERPERRVDSERAPERHREEREGRYSARFGGMFVLVGKCGRI